MDFAYGFAFANAWRAEQDDVEIWAEELLAELSVAASVTEESGNH